MWMFRECGAPYLFLHAVMNPDVSWRTQQFRCHKNSSQWKLECSLFRLKWGGEAEPVLPTRTKNDIVKGPTTIKFSNPEELNLPPKLVKR